MLKGALAIAEGSSRPALDSDLVSAGLPSSPPAHDDDSKAKRARRSAEAIPDGELRDVAIGLVNQGEWLSMVDCMAVQDLLWTQERHPTIDKRTRRDIARALPGAILTEHYQRFRTLLSGLFDLSRGELLFLSVDDHHSLGAQIDRHFHRNDDWAVEQLFDELGAFDASDRRFALLIEGIVSGATVPDESDQRKLVEAMNGPLARVGLELREMDNQDGYPTFELVALRSRKGRPKQLIFASPRKPDLRLIDAIDSDVEAVDHAGDILVYDRPIGSAGLRWRDLQEWWKDVHQLQDDAQAKKQLWQRLGQGLPEDSPHQTLLFKLYHEIHRDAGQDLPALLPEVWRHWDPKTMKQRGKDALVQFRMDFLILAPAGARIVLEVDGQTHYASERHVAPQQRRWLPDGDRYTHTMAQTRDLTLAGYEVYRFGTNELRDDDETRAMLAGFFHQLFLSHRIVIPGRTA